MALGSYIDQETTVSPSIDVYSFSMKKYTKQIMFGGKKDDIFIIPKIQTDRTNQHVGAILL